MWHESLLLLPQTSSSSKDLFFLTHCTNPINYIWIKSLWDSSLWNEALCYSLSQKCEHVGERKPPCLLTSPTVKSECGECCFYLSWQGQILLWNGTSVRRKGSKRYHGTPRRSPSALRCSPSCWGITPSPSRGLPLRAPTHWSFFPLLTPLRVCSSP